MSVAKNAPPLCRFCGKPIRKRTENIYVFPEAPRTHVPEMAWGTGADRFKQMPTGRMTAIHVPKHIVGTLRSKSEAQRLVNMQIVSLRKHENGTISRVSVWDGESYGDGYFCNSDHARRYAYAVVESEHNRAVMPAYAKAVRKAEGGT